MREAPAVEIDLLLAAAAAVPDREAVRLGDQVLTYSELRVACARLAGALGTAGVRAGDVVAIPMDNAVELVVAYFATQWAGAVAMPLNPREAPARLRYCVERAAARAAITRTTTDPVRAALGDLAGVTWLAVAEAGAASPAPPPAPGDAEAVALVMFTTGTTGSPKGVTLRHRSTLAAMHGIAAFMQVPEGTVEVVPTPLYHSFALARMRVVFHRRGTLVLERGFVFPARLLDVVERRAATGFASVPAGWEILLAGDAERLRAAFRTVRYVEIGSAAMRADRKRRLMELLPEARLCMHYGLTEASRAAFMELHAEAADLETVGRPLPGVEIAIRDGAGQPVPDGAEGEICVAGSIVFAGYLGDAAGTADAFFGPWMRTGDLGRRAPDGRFYLTGRLKELINLGGTKVSPLDIERALDTCPGVRECAVIGVAGPGVTGEEIHAFVVPSGPDLSVDTVRAFAAARLDPLHRPARVHLVAELPRTASGKLQRLKLRDALGPGAPPPG